MTKFAPGDHVELSGEHRGQYEWMRPGTAVSRGVAKVLGVVGDDVRVQWIAVAEREMIGMWCVLERWQLRKVPADQLIQACVCAFSGNRVKRNQPVDWDRLSALVAADRVIDEHFVLKYPGQRNMARTVIADRLQELAS